MEQEKVRKEAEAPERIRQAQEKETPLRQHSSTKLRCNVLIRNTASTNLLKHLRSPTLYAYRCLQAVQAFADLVPEETVPCKEQPWS